MTLDSYHLHWRSAAVRHIQALESGCNLCKQQQPPGAHFGTMCWAELPSLQPLQDMQLFQAGQITSATIPHDRDLGQHGAQRGNTS